MDKKSFLLFAIILTCLVSSACGAGQDNSACPPWATPTFGKRCQTLVLPITPDDNIGLYTWEIGVIKLNHSYVANVYGIEFFDSDGSEIKPKAMQDGVYYFFKKTVKSGAFHIWPDEDYSSSSGTTLVILAKPYNAKP